MGLCVEVKFIGGDDLGRTWYINVIPFEVNGLNNYSFLKYFNCH